MPGLDMQNYATYPYYARSIASIMPGRTWRDNGHKALCPLSGPWMQLSLSLSSNDRIGFFFVALLCCVSMNFGA